MNKKTILLVEDNPDDVDLMLEALSRQNIRHDVTVARDGAEALEILHGSGQSDASLAPLPSLVLLDLNLPKLHGLDVLKSIREHARTATIPCVILTTSVEDRDVRDGYRLGANAYVQKQIGFNEFMASAGRLAMFWLQTNVLPQPA